LQVVLIVAVVAMGGYFLANNHSRAQAWKKIAGSLFIACAIFAIMFPSIADVGASFLGLARGTDLILYGLILVMIYLVFSRSFAQKREQERIAKLVRKVAILEKKMEETTSVKKSNKHKKS